MSTISDLRLGDIGFGPVGGWFQAPDVIGQFILGEGFAVGDVQVGHVFVVTQGIGPAQSASEAPFGPLLAARGTGQFHAYPKCVEAMPGGAVEVAIPERWTSRFAYVRLPEDYPGQAEDAAAIARAMIGTPYSFASYAALAAWRFGLKTRRLEAWIDRRRSCPYPDDLSDDFFTHAPIRPPVSVNGHFMASPLQLPAEAICSVLADQAWALTGKQVMPAGTPHQCVTPGALARALLEMPGAEWMWPQ